MPPSKPPSDELIARAAELRAGGMNWEAVAAKVGRAADTVRRWSALYPDRWQAALHAAERRLVAEAGAESVLVLRKLLRSDDEKVARDAARFLVYLRLELAKLDHKSSPPAAPPPTSDAARFVAFLEDQSDEQLAQLVADLHPAPPPQPPPTLSTPDVRPD